jgi:antitoxin HicB
MRLTYPIEIRAMTEEEGGGYLVEFPDWDGAVTDGVDIAEAMENARDCLDELLAYRIRQRIPIPTPSPAGNRRLVAPEAGIALKAALWLGLCENGMATEGLAARLGDLSDRDVDRLLNPRLKTRPESIQRALAVLGKRVTVELEDAA